MKSLLSTLLLAALASFAAADEVIRVMPERVPELIKIMPQKVATQGAGLAPAKLFPPLGAISYPITTSSPKCQEFFDQGLNYYYSYVWMEAVRSFEAAVKHDPNCPMAHLALSKAIEKWGKGSASASLAKAKELLPKASHREALLIKARLAEKGQLDGGKKDAVKYLDELIALYDNDEEAWFARAQLAEGPNAAVPFYKSLLRINPLHAGAHHELIHHYENMKRPALGWMHGEKYIESAHGLSHAYHMQAHLATRIGKWEQTTDRSLKAIELEQAYHKAYGIKPNEDWQYTHHLEVLTVSLVHDGRFAEARKIKADAEAAKYNHVMPWFALHLRERDWDSALKVVDLNKKDKSRRNYMKALVYLAKGETSRAETEIKELQDAHKQKKGDKDLELRLWEVRGQYLCQTGDADEGLKLLEKTVQRTKDDYSKHSWGHGAYYMEGWGIAALRCGKLDVAEEAFLEALAHDAGSVRGALGMQVVCERMHRDEEAARFASLAARCWRRADAGRLEQELQAMRSLKVDQTPASGGRQPPEGQDPTPEK